MAEFPRFGHFVRSSPPFVGCLCSLRLTSSRFVAPVPRAHSSLVSHVS